MKVSQKFLKIGLVMLLLIFFTSCSDIKEVQKMSYVTAVGVDFQNNEYIGYIQLVSFQGEATEGGTGEPSVWVSETKGKTFDEALSTAYNTAQERLLWAHVNTILVSEAALNEGFHHIFDVLTRYYELRLTTWIFGTNDPIKEVFSTTSFFNQSGLETILHQPQGTYEQNSTIRPIKLQKFARELYEPVLTTYLPSVSINTEDWVHNLKKDPKLEIDGAFFIKNKNFKGFYTLEELNGLRWLTPETERAGVQILDKEGEPDFNIVFERNDIKIKPLKTKIQEKPKFDIRINLEGVISNRDENKITNIEKMEDSIREEIKKEILNLYQLGVEKDTDFFRLEHKLFREQHKTWKQLRAGGGKILTDDLLEEIKLDVTVKHSGALKNRTIKMEDVE
jgi:Ger(x)C family germination protein